MQKFNLFKTIITSVAIAVLTACGGGGDGESELTVDELKAIQDAFGYSYAIGNADKTFATADGSAPALAALAMMNDISKTYDFHAFANIHSASVSSDFSTRGSNDLIKNGYIKEGSRSGTDAKVYFQSKQKPTDGTYTIVDTKVYLGSVVDAGNSASNAGFVNAPMYVALVAPNTDLTDTTEVVFTLSDKQVFGNGLNRTLVQTKIVASSEKCLSTVSGTTLNMNGTADLKYVDGSDADVEKWAPSAQRLAIIEKAMKDIDMVTVNQSYAAIFVDVGCFNAIDVNGNSDMHITYHETTGTINNAPLTGETATRYYASIPSAFTVLDLTTPGNLTDTIEVDLVDTFVKYEGTGFGVGKYILSMSFVDGSDISNTSFKVEFDIADDRH